MLITALSYSSSFRIQNGGKLRYHRYHLNSIRIVKTSNSNQILVTNRARRKPRTPCSFPTDLSSGFRGRFGMYPGSSKSIPPMRSSGQTAHSLVDHPLTITKGDPAPVVHRRFYEVNLIGQTGIDSASASAMIYSREDKERDGENEASTKESFRRRSRRWWLRFGVRRP